MGILTVNEETIFANGTPYSLFRQILDQCPSDLAYVWLDDQGKESKRLTFQQTDERIECISLHLIHSCGLKKGDRAMLIYPPGLEFMFAMIACMKVGIIAVPAYPPNPKRLKQDLQRLDNLITSSTPSLVLTDKFFNRIRWLSATTTKWPAPHLKWHISDSWTTPPSTSSLPACFSRSPTSFHATAIPPTHQPTHEDIAYLQYTSGSTGNPKGVVITHGNLYHNLLAILANTDRSDQIKDQVAVTWLPQYHDMGLLNYFIPFISGRPLHAMSPLTFISNPLLWVKAISDARATHSWAPNFAFEIAAKRALAAPPGSLKLDLSTMVVLASGGEPVLASTMTRFRKVFGPYGLNPLCINPNYGLAENVVYVCSNPVLSDLTIDPDTDRVACGVPSPEVGIDVRIVDPESGVQLKGEGQVGEIWVTGPSTAVGYWQLEELTQEQFYAKLRGADGGELAGSPRFLRTGDLGFVKGGLMYVCGRIKDLIIVGGKNYYPQDIEGELTAKFQQIRPGCIGAFSLLPPGQDATGHAEDGSLGIVTELREEHVRMGAAAAQKLAKEIADSVMEDSGLSVRSVALLPPRSIPKTTSGKVQRFRCRQLLSERTAGVIDGGWWTSSETRAKAGQPVGGEVEGGELGAAMLSAPGPLTLALRLREKVPGESEIAGLLAGLEARMLTVFKSFGVTKFDLDVGSSGLPSVQLYPLLDDLNAAAAPLKMNLQELLAHTPSSLVLAACRSFSATLRIQWAVRTLLLQKRNRAAATPPALTTATSRASLLWQRAYAAAVAQSGIPIAAIHAELADSSAPRLGRGTRVIQKPSLRTPAQPSSRVPNWWRNVLQTMGGVMVYLLVALCIMPSYSYARFIRQVSIPSPWGSIQVMGHECPYGLLFPLILPIWALTFSATVIVVKWAMIGQYRETCVSTDSYYFLRWWFVDRLVEFWHSWIGIYAKDSILMNLFCVLMGADVSWSACICSTIYEFDLVKIDDDAEVEGVLLCRVLLPGKLYFQRVHVGAHAEIRDGAVVEPGSTIETGCVLDDLAVTGEHASTTPWTFYSGNVMKAVKQLKAVRDDDEGTSSTWVILEAMKIATVLLPLYMFFMYNVVFEICFYLTGKSPALTSFRYWDILHIIVGFLLSATSVVITVVVMKWVLIGRRKAGPTSGSLWAEYREWLFGYLDTFCQKILVEYLDGSPMLTLLYWALGARIHLLTSIFNNSEALTFTEADLFRGGKFLFCSDSHFRFDALEEDVKTEVHLADNVELGFGSAVGPAVKALPGSGIGAYTRVANMEIDTATVVFGNPSSKLGRSKELQDAHSLRHHLSFPYLLALFLGGIIIRLMAILSILFTTALPAYELALSVPHFYKCSQGPGERRFCYVPIVVIAVMFIVAAAGILLWYRILTDLILRTVMRAGRIPAWSFAAIWYTNYTVVGYAATLLLKPFQCTALGNWALRFLGVKVGNNVTMNTWEIVWDTLGITVEDGAVLDRCGVVAHHLDFGAIKFAPVCIGRRATVQFWSDVWTGVELEEGVTLGPLTLCMANSTMKGGCHYQGSPAAVYEIAPLPDQQSEQDCAINMAKHGRV